MTEKENNAGEVPGVVVAPVLPIRDLVIFPRMMLPLFIARPKTVRAVQNAMKGDKRIVLVTQRDPKMDDPKASDVYDVGTLATLMQMLRLPDGTLKVLVEAHGRVKLSDIDDKSPEMTCKATRLDSTDIEGTETEALRRRCLKCSIRNKTAPSRITTSIWTLICRTSCLWPPATATTFRRRFLTVWK